MYLELVAAAAQVLLGELAATAAEEMEELKQLQLLEPKTQAVAAEEAFPQVVQEL
jgi:hypothetical protein